MGLADARFALVLVERLPQCRAASSSPGAAPVGWPHATRLWLAPAAVGLNAMSRSRQAADEHVVEDEDGLVAHRPPA
jgi:hypothetical protein